MSLFKLAIFSKPVLYFSFSPLVPKKKIIIITHLKLFSARKAVILFTGNLYLSLCRIVVKSCPWPYVFGQKLHNFMSKFGHFGQL